MLAYSISLWQNEHYSFVLVEPLGKLPSVRSVNKPQTSSIVLKRIKEKIRSMVSTPAFTL